MNAAQRKRFLFTAAALGGVAAMLAACADPQKKDEAEIAKNSIVCKYNGERLVIRFDSGEAWMLIGGADRVTLYEIPMPPGTPGQRYSNGTMELRGKGMNLQLIRDGTATVLTECAPYVLPKK